MQGLAGSNDAKRYQKQPYKMPDEPILDYGKNSLNNMEKLPDLEKIPDLESGGGLVDKRKIPNGTKDELGTRPEELVASIEDKKQSGKKKKNKRRRDSSSEVDNSDRDIKNLVDEAKEIFF